MAEFTSISVWEGMVYGPSMGEWKAIVCRWERNYWAAADGREIKKKNIAVENTSEAFNQFSLLKRE